MLVLEKVRRTHFIIMLLRFREPSLDLPSTTTMRTRSGSKFLDVVAFVHFLSWRSELHQLFHHSYIVGDSPFLASREILYDKCSINIFCDEIVSSLKFEIVLFGELI